MTITGSIHHNMAKKKSGPTKPGLSKSPYLDKLPRRVAVQTGHSSLRRTMRRDGAVSAEPLGRPSSLPPLAPTSVRDAAARNKRGPTTKTQRRIEAMQRRLDPETARADAAEAELAAANAIGATRPLSHAAQSEAATPAGDTSELIARLKAAEALASASAKAAEAANMRAKAAELKLEQHTGMVKKTTQLNWRLSSKLAAKSGSASPKPCPAPPADNDTSTTLRSAEANSAALASWLTSGGTQMICSVAAKTMIQMVELGGVLLANDAEELMQQARLAAEAAAGKELARTESKPQDTIKAALDGAATLVAGKLKTMSAFNKAAQAAAAADSMSIVSNAAARAWWLEYIGERRSVRSQLIIDAMALWFQKEGLPEPEAQIFGALAVYGIDEDSDGDITIEEFGNFTKPMKNEFTVASVRTFEVIRDDPDAGSAEEFAVYLGIDQKTEPHLMWIAEQCRVAPLPMGWQEYIADDGRSYFHNAHRGETVWHHPLDPHFKQLVAVRRKSHLEYKPGETYKQ